MVANKTFYKKWSKALISKDYTFKQTIRNLNLTALQICFVVNKKNKLIGSITDGDIRRAILKGCSLKDKITKYVNYKPKKIYANLSITHQKNILNKYKLLNFPVINKKGQIIDLLTWNDLNYFNNYSDVPVVYFVGGKGSRLAPLTNSIPKPMIKVKGIPILEKLVLKAKSEGFKNFFFITNYLENKIIKYFKDGKKLGVSIIYIREKKPLGTAGGLGLFNFNCKKIIVSNGDILTDVSYKNLMTYHISNNNDLTVGVKKIKISNPYGVFKIKNKGKIDTFVEKPIESHFVSAGVYVLNSSILKLIKKNIYLDMTQLVDLVMKKKYKINVFPIHENWIDIGTHENLNKFLK
jgi:dTDP-glucose pyrophosphorylase